MNDEKLDQLLNEAFEREVVAPITLVQSARQKVDKKKENKERIKDYLPIIMMVVVSTIITLLSSVMVYLYIGSLKLFVAVLVGGMSVAQLPIMICLLGSLYYKEIKE